MLEMSESDISIASVSEVLDKFSSFGCCHICCLRFVGETSSEKFKEAVFYREEKAFPQESDQTAVDNCAKKKAENACIACLGLLQPPMCYRIIDKIIDAVKEEEYDNPSFNIAFTLPVSFYLRNHGLVVLLAENYHEFFKKHFPLGVVTIGVKDAWKYAFADRISDKIQKKFSIDSELRIQVDVQYEDDHKEIECLLDMYPSMFKEQKIKTRKLRHVKGPVSTTISRKSVESVLTLNDRSYFAQFYTIPPSVPTHSAVCNNVLFEHTPVYIAGRYNKFVRGLPQTAWLVNDERRMETSVHELMGDIIQQVTKSQGSKLISSGREDVDVRMLGSGRPFALELISPRHIALTSAELKQLEDRINSNATGRMRVNRLRFVSKRSLELLKSGEEKKTKTYEAYCIVSRVEEHTLKCVEERAPLTLQQKTPVRVLHRRPIATRPRVVHWMKVSDVVTDGDSTYFKLLLNTQAGTYIKEFIHGDFGRTKPSFGDLLGGLTADCLALDVQSIELEWPPK